MYQKPLEITNRKDKMNYVMIYELSFSENLLRSLEDKFNGITIYNSSTFKKLSTRTIKQPPYDNDYLVYAQDYGN